MATAYSVDLFVKEVCLVVIFLSDGEVLYMPDYKIEDNGKMIEKGEILHIERIIIDDKEKSEELSSAVVLGTGESRDEAVHNAKTYIQRVMKWHQQEPGSLTFMSFDVSESQVFL